MARAGKRAGWQQGTTGRCLLGRAPQGIVFGAQSQHGWWFLELPHRPTLGKRDFQPGVSSQGSPACGRPAG